MKKEKNEKATTNLKKRNGTLCQLSSRGKRGGCSPVEKRKKEEWKCSSFFNSFVKKRGTPTTARKIRVQRVSQRDSPKNRTTGKKKFNATEKKGGNKVLRDEFQKKGKNSGTGPVSFDSYKKKKVEHQKKKKKKSRACVASSYPEKNQGKSRIVAEEGTEGGRKSYLVGF